MGGIQPKEELPKTFSGLHPELASWAVEELVEAARHLEELEEKYDIVFQTPGDPTAPSQLLQELYIARCAVFSELGRRKLRDFEERERRIKNDPF